MLGLLFCADILKFAIILNRGFCTLFCIRSCKLCSCPCLSQEVNGGPVYEGRGGQKRDIWGGIWSLDHGQFERLVRHPSGTAKIVV